MCCFFPNKDMLRKLFPGAQIGQLWIHLHQMLPLRVSRAYFVNWISNALKQAWYRVTAGQRSRWARKCSIPAVCFCFKKCAGCSLTGLARGRSWKQGYGYCTRSCYCLFVCFAVTTGVAWGLRAIVAHVFAAAAVLCIHLGWCHVSSAHCCYVADCSCLNLGFVIGVYAY